MKLCGSCVASVRRLQYLSLVCLCHQKKAFPLRFWLPGHKLQYRTFIIIIIINNYLLYIMHHVVVVYSCIPTLQDYQTWVSVVHCAWHPLSHHYLSVLAIIIFFFFFLEEKFHPAVPARLRGPIMLISSSMILNETSLEKLCFFTVHKNIKSPLFIIISSSSSSLKCLFKPLST